MTLSVLTSVLMFTPSASSRTARVWRLSQERHYLSAVGLGDMA